jgi:hypothetical protein
LAGCTQPIRQFLKESKKQNDYFKLLYDESNNTTPGGKVRLDEQRE